MKQLIVFDLDGTLAESKSSLDPEMSSLIHDLLGIVKVAVISGGAWKQFKDQLLAERGERDLAATVFDLLAQTFLTFTPAAATASLREVTILARSAALRSSA